MPFYVIPGDLLFLSPMYFTNRQKYTELAVTAANGGLLGWQQGYATSIGRFQFVLGRELGAQVLAEPLPQLGADMRPRLDGDDADFVPELVHDGDVSG